MPKKPGKLTLYDQLPVRHQIATNIRIGLKRKGLLIQDLYQATHIHRHTMSEIMTGKRSVTVEELLLISNALGCDISELIPELDARSGGLKLAETVSLHG